MLVGRDLETAHLAGLLERARHGSSASLVVRGEPGVGKSALLEELVAGAGEALVLRTQGLEVEAPLAFAALHRLLLPVMRLREGLPAPQARALGVAFGEEDGPSILRGQALEAGETHALDYPGFVPAYIRPLFCRGKGPFRWIALSGDPEDIYRTDEALLETLPRQ